jgi:hypothetical protein
VIDNSLLVVDGNNDRLHSFDLKSWPPRDVIVTDQLQRPMGLAVCQDNTSWIAVTQTTTHQIGLLRHSTIFQQIGKQGSDPAQFNNPGGVAFWRNHLIVADTKNHRLQMITWEA